jgi:hypothetical protein
MWTHAEGDTVVCICDGREHSSEDEGSILEVGGNLVGRGVDFLVPMFYILPF